MPYKLLLADDSLTIQKVVELVLTPENFEIRAFNDGEQALQALESFKPDIVLADIEMPKLNGYQLCEKIKNNMATATIPVILLAGAFEPFDEEYAKSVFADDFIIKPFESQELISKVKALLVGFEQAKKTEPGEEREEDLLVGAEQAPEVNIELSGEAAPEGKDEPKWDEEIPVVEEKLEETMTDEEYEAKVALFHEAGAEKKGFHEELVKALEDSKEIQVSSEVKDITSKVIKEKISAEISGDIISSAIKESVESVITALAPKIIEDVTRDLMTELMESMRGEIDAAIKKIVPEVAETLIKKEIEKITSQIADSN